MLWGLSNAQLASAGAALAGVALIWWASSRPAQEAESVPAIVQKPA
jgi:hypothetical protein